MKPSREDIQKAIMLYLFGNMNPDVPPQRIEDIERDAVDIWTQWDDEPDPKPICFNHTCPNNMFDGEDGCGSYCIETFCEYVCQRLSPDDACHGKS